jgi:hypothetical protein
VKATADSAITPPSATGSAPPERGRQRRSGTPQAPGGSREARLRAAAVLDVFAGVSTPAAAASALGVSLPRYYTFETRLMEALVAACENRGRGPGRSAEREIERLQGEVERLKQECARKQALVRAVHRTMGLPLADASRHPPKGKRRPRRPTVRALKAAGALRTAAESQPAADPTA